MTPVLHRIESGGRTLGFVAIDSTIAGRARGGLRLAPDVGEAEIQGAARAMTLKYGLLGLPQGGAKAGVVGDPEAPAPERRARLNAFAAAAAPLLRERAYVPDADLGTSADDIRAMVESLGRRVGPREWGANRSGTYTAHSCLGALEAIAARRGTPLAGQRVAIEGFGKVGAGLAGLLHARGARIVAVSTSRGALYREEGLDVPRLAARAARDGSAFVETEGERLEPAALLELDVDLLLPCARFQSLHAGNVDRVTAPVVCAGANDPASAEAERRLFARGVVHPPDFVSNCGGVLGGTLEFAGVAPGRVAGLVQDAVRRYTASLLERAAREGVAPRAVAEREALERHAQVRRGVENPGLRQRVVGLGIEAYRRGLVPAPLMALLAPRFLDGWSRA